MDTRKDGDSRRSASSAPVTIVGIDGAVAVGLAALLIAFLHVHGSTALWGDGIPLVQEMELPWRPWWWLHYHAAYVPIAEGLAALHPAHRGYPGYLLASSLPVVAAGAFGYLTSRHLGAGRVASAAGWLLFTLAPFCAFFGTVVEVHALHLGGVALALFGSVASRHITSDRVYLGVQAALFLPIAASHTTSLFLIPGWALWQSTAIARDRPAIAARLGRARLFAASSVAALAAWCACLAAIEVSWSLNGMGSSTAYMAGTVQEHVKPFALHYLLEEWVTPLGWAAPFLALVAVVSAWPRRRGPEWDLTRIALVATVPALIGFNVWNVRFNEGGYLCGVAPFFALATVAAVQHFTARSRSVVLTALIVALIGQAASTHHMLDELRSSERRSKPAILEAVVQHEPQGGALLTFMSPVWNVATEGANWVHVDLSYLLRQDAAGNYRREIGVFFDQRLDFDEPLVVLDLDHARQVRGLRRHTERINAILAYLEQRCTFEETTLDGRPVAILRAR